MVKPTPAQRKKYSVGPRETYPIYSRASAKSAEALKGKHPELASTIDRAAAKYGVGPKKPRST